MKYIVLFCLLSSLTVQSATFFTNIRNLYFAGSAELHPLISYEKKWLSTSQNTQEIIKHCDAFLRNLARIYSTPVRCAYQIVINKSEDELTLQFLHMIDYLSKEPNRRQRPLKLDKELEEIIKITQLLQEVLINVCTTTQKKLHEKLYINEAAHRHLPPHQIKHEYKAIINATIELTEKMDNDKALLQIAHEMISMIKKGMIPPGIQIDDAFIKNYKNILFFGLADHLRTTPLTKLPQKPHWFRPKGQKPVWHHFETKNMPFLQKEDIDAYTAIVEEPIKKWHKVHSIGLPQTAQKLESLYNTAKAAAETISITPEILLAILLENSVDEERLTEIEAHQKTWYRAQARKLHPDKSQDDGAAMKKLNEENETMKQKIEAFRTLSPFIAQLSKGAQEEAEIFNHSLSPDEILDTYIKFRTTADFALRTTLGIKPHKNLTQWFEKTYNSAAWIRNEQRKKCHTQLETEIIKKWRREHPELFEKPSLVELLTKSSTYKTNSEQEKNSEASKEPLMLMAPE